jgi:hypothetical protein
MGVCLRARAPSTRGTRPSLGRGRVSCAYGGCARYLPEQEGKSERPGTSVTERSGDMGDTFVRLSLPKASAMFMGLSAKRPMLRGLSSRVQTPASISSRPTAWPAQTVETLPPALFPRRPPLARTERPSQRSGSARGGMRSGVGRGEGRAQDAGVCLSRAAGGLSCLKAARKGSQRRCWAARLAAGGRVVAACRVRGRRAGRPFG